MLTRSSQPKLPSRTRHAAHLAATISGFALAASGLTGCGAARLTPPAAGPAAIHLHGSAHGGQQPVSGAVIQLYTAGSTGNGSAATAMLTTPVLTDASGSFDITGDYACANPGDQVYIAATGGNPGLNGTVDNAALALVTALGDCGSLAGISNISINEVTTVAAAWALAPFASSITHVGASSTNQAGLHNAMLTAMMLADSTTGSAPSASLPANATTETAKLYTLANIIAFCVNSDGSSPCASLFTDAAAGSFPTLSDTFQTALAIVSNPANNVAQLFNDAPPHAAFGGSLTHAPSDWTISIAYTGGGLDSPAGLAIDRNGGVLISNIGGALSSFSAQGVPVWQNGLSGSGLDQSVGVAIDSASNIWVANMLSPSASPGSLTQIAPSGTVLSGSDGYRGGTINQPASLAADTAGNVWVANLGAHSVTLLDSSGNVLSGVNGFGASILTRPTAITIDAAQTAWVVDASGLLLNLDASGNVLRQVPCCGAGDSIALDSAGTVWVGDNANSVLGQVTATTYTSGINGGGLNGPRALSVDGADHIWITDNTGNSLAEFGGTASPQGLGNALSPATGLGLDAQMRQPFGVGIDQSGSVWVTSMGDNRLITFVGLGTPVRTPRFGLPQQP